MVHPGSRRISRVRRYSGTFCKIKDFRIQGYHLLWLNFPVYSTNLIFSDLLVHLQLYLECPTTPLMQRLQAYTLKVWAISRSLAATKEISIDFYSSGYLDVSVLQVAFLTLCVQIRMHRHDSMRVSPFGNLRINACSGSPKLIAAVHVLLHTAHQDIPHMPLIS